MNEMAEFVTNKSNLNPKNLVSNIRNQIGCILYGTSLDSRSRGDGSFFYFGFCIRKYLKYFTIGNDFRHYGLIKMG